MNLMPGLSLQGRDVLGRCTLRVECVSDQVKPIGLVMRGLQG